MQIYFYFLYICFLFKFLLVIAILHMNIKLENSKIRFKVICLNYFNQIYSVLVMNPVNKDLVREILGDHLCFTKEVINRSILFKKKQNIKLILSIKRINYNGSYNLRLFTLFQLFLIYFQII